MSLMSRFGIDRLSVQERFQLLKELVESLGPDAEETPLSAAEKEEIDQRLAALDANPDAVSPWEVEARILAKLKN